MNGVVFMGTPRFAEGILNALICSEYHVECVFTQPDKPRGRKGNIIQMPVKKLADERGIPVYQPERISGHDNVRILRDISPKFIVVAAYGQIIPKTVLEIPEHGILNVHASLLPKWRGAAPVQWSILAGENETGVTIMQMSEGLDTGDIIDQTIVPITKDETGSSLLDKLMIEGADLLIKTMRRIESGQATWTRQPELSPTPYARMLTRKMGRIHWSESAVEIERMIRGFIPWPGAYTYLDGKMLKIWKSSVHDSHSDARAGTILLSCGDIFEVQTGNGSLLLEEVQLEGRKRMRSDAFLRGYRPTRGALMD